MSLDQSPRSDTGPVIDRGPVIDLGFIEQDAVDIDRRPARSMRTLGRRAIAVVTAVFAAVSLTASTAARSDQPQPVFTVDIFEGGSRVVTGSTMFVTNLRRAGATGSAGVSAYALADGARRWTTDLAEPVFGMTVSERDGVLFAESADRVTHALDLATGRQLWSAPGTATSSAEGVALLTTYSADASPHRVQAVNALSGTPAWSLEVDASASVMTTSSAPDPQPTDTPLADVPDLDRVVVVELTGDTTVYRLSDGAVVTRGRVEAAPPNPADDGVYSYSNVIDGVLYTSVHDTNRTSLAAYRVDTLQQVWKVAGEVLTSFSMRCGDDICMRAAPGLALLDRSSGRIRWRVDKGRLAGTVRADRLLVENGDDRQPRWALLDMASGRTVSELGRGTWPAGSVNLFLRPATQPKDNASTSTIVTVDNDGNVVDGTPWMEGRNYVVSVDRGTGAQRVLGTLDLPAPQGCEVSGAYLICPTGANGVSVWRIRD
jgi:outer membrane protein assembly factor BamB